MRLQSMLKTLLYRCGYTIKRLQPVRKARPGLAEGNFLPPAELRSRLHAVDPYVGFDASAWPMDSQGWGSKTAAFRELITRVKPSLIIEVGTWKGGSALHMADCCRDAGLATHILCVDTWLGALEFWTDQRDSERYGSLKLRHGWPQVYYQFLANVCHRGHSERITPFPQTSATAAIWLRIQRVQASLIYIDGSHEEDDVYADLLAYWDLVIPGGILFGDDWAWDGVRLAVERFTQEQSLKIAFVADKWMIAK